MLQEISRPLDLLNALKGKEVIVKTKAYKEYEIEGVLHAFDIHINLVIETKENKKEEFVFIRGENVLFVKERK